MRRNALAIQLQFTRVRKRQGPQIFDEALKMLDFLVHHVQARRIRLQHSCAQRFDVAADDGERRPQIVRDVGVLPIECCAGLRANDLLVLS